MIMISRSWQFPMMTNASSDSSHISTLLPTSIYLPKFTANQPSYNPTYLPALLHVYLSTWLLPNYSSTDQMFTAQLQLYRLITPVPAATLLKTLKKTECLQRSWIQQSWHHVQSWQFLVSLNISFSLDQDMIWLLIVRAVRRISLEPIQAKSSRITEIVFVDGSEGLKQNCKFFDGNRAFQHECKFLTDLLSIVVFQP